MNIINFEKVKVTSWKIIVLKYCSIFYLHSEYYIPEIENLDLHLPHVCILGKNKYAGKRNDMFVSQHNKEGRKYACDYVEICHIMSEQVSYQ